MPADFDPSETNHEVIVSANSVAASADASLPWRMMLSQAEADLTEACATIERLEGGLAAMGKAVVQAAGSLMWCERRLPPGYGGSVRRLVRELGFDPAEFERSGATPSLLDHGWYSTMRREVEAAHAATRQRAPVFEGYPE